MDVKGNCKLKVKPKNMHVAFCSQCTPAICYKSRKLLLFFSQSGKNYSEIIFAQI